MLNDLGGWVADYGHAHTHSIRDYQKDNKKYDKYTHTEHEEGRTFHTANDHPPKHANPTGDNYGMMRSMRSDKSLSSVHDPTTAHHVYSFQQLNSLYHAHNNSLQATTSATESTASIMNPHSYKPHPSNPHFSKPQSFNLNFSNSHPSNPPSSKYYDHDAPSSSSSSTNSTSSNCSSICSSQKREEKKVDILKLTRSNDIAKEAAAFLLGMLI